MTFAAGVDGRAADEFSFIPVSKAFVAWQTRLTLGMSDGPNELCPWISPEPRDHLAGKRSPPLTLVPMANSVSSCAIHSSMRVVNPRAPKRLCVYLLLDGNPMLTLEQCQTVKTTIDAQLDSGALSKDQSYADAWLSGVRTFLLCCEPVLMMIAARTSVRCPVYVEWFGIWSSHSRWSSGQRRGSGWKCQRRYGSRLDCRIWSSSKSHAHGSGGRFDRIGCEQRRGGRWWKQRPDVHGGPEWCESSSSDRERRFGQT